MTSGNANQWDCVLSEGARSGATVSGPSVRLSEPAVQESMADELQVDRAGRVVRDVAIAGCVSRNGYRYAASALAVAAPLYEGKPVFLDHAADPDKPHARSTRDLVGTVENVRFDAVSELLRGDVRVLDTESGKTFLALCEAGRPGVGMSHVVLARRSADGSVVEEIEKVISVDAVVFPATTQSLSEMDQGMEDAAAGDSASDANAGEDVVNDDTPEPDHGTHNCAACEADRAALTQERDALQQRVEDLLTQVDALQTQVDELTTQTQVAERERLLAASGLSDQAVSDVFRRLVLEAQCDATARRLIADRVSLVREARVARPISEGRTDRGLETDRAFAAAVRA